MHQKKAISPIISIIILLLITIAIASTGYSYLLTYWTSLTNKQIQVLDASCYSGSQGKIIVRNIGTNSIDTTEIKVINTQTGQDISQEVLWSSSAGDPNLALQLRFDEGSGTKAYDTSGQGNDGTLKNATGATCFTDGACPEWVNGKIGSALDFDGDGDYIDCGNDQSLNITDVVTMSAWVNPDILSGIHQIVNKGSDHYAIQIWGNIAVFAVQDPADIEMINQLENFKYWDFYWGKEEDAPPNNARYVYDNGEADDIFDMLLNNLSSYNTIVLEDPHGAELNNVAEEDMLRDFVNNGGTYIHVQHQQKILEDAFGIEKDGDSDKGTVISLDPILKEGTTTGTHVTFEQNGPVFPISTSPLPLKTIMEVTGVPTKCILCKWTYGNGIIYYMPDLKNDTSEPVPVLNMMGAIFENGIIFRIRYRNESNSVNIVEPGYTFPSTNRWYHLVAIINSGGDVSGYVDGSFIGSTEFIGNSIHFTTSNLYIGTRSAGNIPFNGTIDDVRIYNRALEEDEIKTLAENSVPVRPGETAYMTHTCSGLCTYRLILGGMAKEAMLEC